MGGTLVTGGVTLIGGAASFMLNAAISLFTLFFVFREGRTLRRRLAALLLLTDEQVHKLFSGIENTIVGTAVVWVPGVLYLLATGSWGKALMLVAWCLLVVGMVDNVLRPLLLSGRVQMHTLLIFFAVFGGVSTFGFLGLIIGPVIVAVTGDPPGVVARRGPHVDRRDARAVAGIGRGIEDRREFVQWILPPVAVAVGGAGAPLTGPCRRAPALVPLAARWP